MSGFLIGTQDQAHEGWYTTPASLTVATAMGGVIAYAAYTERDTISKWVPWVFLRQWGCLLFIGIVALHFVGNVDVVSAICHAS